MKKNIYKLFLILGLFIHLPLPALSIVYNFRIAQLTRQPIAQKTNSRPNSASLLLFNLFQKTHAFNIRENYTGGLATYNRNFAERYYFKTDFAVAHVDRNVDKITKVSVTEPDNILISMGRNFTLGKKSNATFSGLLGIPTHSVKTLQRVGFGVGQVGVGAQLDGLYKLCKPVDFLWGIRYNYFIPRTAFDTLGNSYKFTVGSIADILVALQTSNPLSHGLEGGYNARWGFGVHAVPDFANIDQLNYMRNSFYLAYKYTFLTKRVAHRLLLNISYGFDSKPKLYGYDAVIVWGAWGIAF